MNNFSFPLSAVLVMLCAQGIAAVTAEEAKQLDGPSLTFFGAEKSGNKDGSIPPYTGGITKAPSNYDMAKDPGHRPTPPDIAAEKALFTIDAASMAKFADHLTPGTQALLKRWDSYKLNVYKTHRTVPWQDWSKAPCLKAATNAKLVSADGLGVEGAVNGCIPFPIPKNGYEVLFNVGARPQTWAENQQIALNIVDSSGRRTLSSVTNVFVEFPNWNPAEAGKPTNKYNMRLMMDVIAPPRSAGEKTFLTAYWDQTKTDQPAYSYTPGTRRVRMAPEIAYDTPIAYGGGLAFVDEVNLLYGKLDRFNYKLLGKKEIYIPYNSWDLVSGPEDKVFGPKHINSEVDRWELHRVWVVEGTLKEGKNHAYSKRVYYVDEDGFAIGAYEAYDRAGKLQRVGYAYQTPSYEIPVGRNTATVLYDLVKSGYYAASFTPPSVKGLMGLSKPLPESAWAPDALANFGLTR